MQSWDFRKLIQFVQIMILSPFSSYSHIILGLYSIKNAPFSKKLLKIISQWPMLIKEWDFQSKFNLLELKRLAYKKKILKRLEQKDVD